MKRHRGKITIGRVQSSREDDYISIRVEDGASRAMLLAIKMKMEDFAFAVTGLGSVPMEFEVGGLDLIGKVKEVKTEKIWVPHGVPLFKLSTPKSVEDEILAPHEVDGWRAYRDDLYNHHRYGKCNEVAKEIAVSFSRYVDPSDSQSNKAEEE